MAELEYTTVQIDPETRQMLRAVADANERSMAAQIRFMVSREYAALQAARLPAAVSTNPQPSQGA